LNKSIKIFLNYILAPLLFAWLVFSVYQEITAQKDLPLYLHQLYESIDSASFLLLLLVILLMLMQWMFEAIKWQLLLQQLINLPITKALMMIFTGISFSIGTPNRFGEFFGRILHLPKDLRIQATGYTFVGNFAQLIVTCVAGTVGMLVITPNHSSDRLPKLEALLLIFKWVAPILSISFLFVYFKAGLFFSWIAQIKLLQPWKEKLVQLSALSLEVLTKVLFYSLLRYIVILVQYWLIFKVIGVEVDLSQTSIAISIMLFVLSIVPTISLVELGLRWQISILVFAPFTANVFGLTMGVTMIWLFNMIIPAGIGALMMLSYRYPVSE
jgi:hypothetical protein